MSVQKRGIVPADKLESYEKLVAGNPNIERKGTTHPYTSLNGHIFSYLHPSGSLALRLPKGERENFLKKYSRTLFEAYGTVQKGYVTVPHALLKNTKELQKYFEMSFQYVQTLKPKLSKKKS